MPRVALTLKECVECLCSSLSRAGWETLYVRHMGILACFLHVGRLGRAEIDIGSADLLGLVALP